MAGETYSFIGSTCKWGTADFSVGFGTITDIEFGGSSSTEPVENNMGAQVGLVIYDGAETFSMTVVASADGVPPSRGSVIALGGVNYLVTGCTRRYSHKGKTTYTVNGTKPDHMTLTLPSGGGGQEED